MNKRKSKKRIVILPDKTFNLLWTKALVFEAKEDYIRYFTHPGSEGYISFYRKYKLSSLQAGVLLKEIFNKSHLKFEDILNICGITQAKVCDRFCIPRRTVEDWKAQKHPCPPYIRLMILRAYDGINLGNYIYLESNAPDIINKPKTGRVNKAAEDREKLKRILEEEEKKRKERLEKDMDYIGKITKIERIKKNN